MSIRSQRIGIGAVFAVHGAVVGTFATRIPTIAEHLHLSTGVLGAALFLPAVGSLSMMPFTGRLIQRLGGRTSVAVFLTLWCLSLAVPAYATSLPLLCAGLYVYGATSGMADVAMNAQGVELEERIGRSIISGLHGLWSVGGFVGAGIGWLAVRANVDVRWHFSVMAALLAVLGLLMSRLIVEAPPAAAGADTDSDGHSFALPSGAILIIAVVAFCAVFAELAGSDWAAIYLRRVLDSNHATAALGYTVFALTMSAARLSGDTFIRKLGAVRAVRIGASTGTLGAALVVWAPNAPVTLVGFGLMGIGVAVVVPLAFAAAGRIGARTGNTGHAIAGVATIAYGAGLAAPGAIGGIASLTSLRISFLVVTVLVGIVAVSAGVLRNRDADTPATGAIPAARTDGGVTVGASQGDHHAA
jgi:MFS family permease